MCIISNDVKHVSNTKILVAVNTTTNKQLIVYSNTVDNNNITNAMILPVPYPNTVEFIDLSNYKNIFNDCENCLYKPRGKSLNLNATLSVDKKLDVFSIGSYNVSLAMNLNDLKRVDENIFTLSEGCEKVLEKHYKQSFWGFIICQLKSGNENYHPFAYSHKLMQKVFIPTRHYHANSNSYFDRNIFAKEYTAKTSIAKSVMFNSIQPENYNKNITDDWGHDIYLVNLQNTDNQLPKYMNTSRSIWNNTFQIDQSKINFDFGKISNFEKLEIDGEHENLDLVLSY